MSKIYGRTDLALEEMASEKIENTSFSKNNTNVKKVVLGPKEAKKYNKSEGVYYTIETQAFKKEDHDFEQEVIPVIRDVLKDILNGIGVGKKDPVLIVGLGNTSITPDALGPMVVNQVIITKHLNDLNMLEDNMGVVAGIAPGVMGQTGMETSSVIKGVVEQSKPKCVIVIDALASRSMDRVCSSIQITTGGINPGSGVGNSRKEISKRTLGVDVIAIGVPTVVDVESILNDFLGADNLNKLNQREMEKKFEKNPFFLTPKEIDIQINDLSYALSRSLNLALHNL